MSLSERLMADLKEAMRSKDVRRKDAIRMVRAAIKNAEIKWQREASDQEMVEIISGEIRRRNEALEMFRKAGRDDLVAEEEAGLAALSPYVPEQLSREEIAVVLERVITELAATGPKQLGPVMRQAMAELKGRADGHLVSQMAREMLDS